MGEVGHPPRPKIARAGDADGGARDGSRERVALAELPARLSRAVRLFHDLTGFSAVTGLRGEARDALGFEAIAPPVHPRCASGLRNVTDGTPCEAEWRRHLRLGRRSRHAQSHVCSLGLRCACVPVRYGGALVGMAKFVTDARTPERRVALGVLALELVVSRACQDAYVSALADETGALRRQVVELQSVLDLPGRGGAAVAALDGGGDRGDRTARNGSSVNEVVTYVHAHYRDHDLSLGKIGGAVGLSPKYLSHRFTRVVGQRMHAYVVSLRVQHACRELLLTGKAVKEIAYESGFRQADRFRRAFRSRMGVSATAYRRIFARP